MSTQNDLAVTLKGLHTPGSPLILTNIWDAITARTVGSLAGTKALATASYAIAAAAGLNDADLTLEVNLRAIKAIAMVAKELGKPLTADFQDGFGDDLEEGVREVIRAGVVGINLEDFGRDVGGAGALYPLEVAQERIRRVLKVAREEGVPDFVINARTDALLVGKNIDEAIARGKTYLEAGASNVFVWGGRERGGTTREEVEKACEALGGKLNVILARTQPGGLTVEDLKRIGVARISVGPQLMLLTQKAVVETATGILEGQTL